MATSSQTASTDFVRDNYIAIFDNKPSSYRESRQRLLLYYKKMKLQKRVGEATMNLLTSLSGAAWTRVEHLSEPATEQDDGFMTVVQELDKALRLFRTTTDQTLLQFCGEVREATREPERHKISLSKEVQAYVMLKHSGLAAEQRQLVLTQVGTTLTLSKVEATLYFLFGQDYKTTARVTGLRTWRGSSRTGCPLLRGDGLRLVGPYMTEDEPPWAVGGRVGISLSGRG